MRALIAAMDEHTRKEWDIMRAAHENQLQDIRAADTTRGLSEQVQNDRQAELRPKLEEVEQKFLDEFRERLGRDTPPDGPEPPPISRFMRDPAPLEPEVVQGTMTADQQWINEAVANQIDQAQVRGDLQPVSFDRHVAADANVFDARRNDVREFCREQIQKELDATLQGMNDPEVEALARQTVEARWAKIESDRLDAIAREEADRLERTRDLYGLARD
jgi:hypothetical protein